MIESPWGSEQERVDARDAAWAREQARETERAENERALTPEELAAMTRDCEESDAADRAEAAEVARRYDRPWND